MLDQSLPGTPKRSLSRLRVAFARSRFRNSSHKSLLRLHLHNAFYGTRKCRSLSRTISRRHSLVPQDLSSSCDFTLTLLIVRVSIHAAQRRSEFHRSKPYHSDPYVLAYDSLGWTTKRSLLSHYLLPVRLWRLPPDGDLT